MEPETDKQPKYKPSDKNLMEGFKDDFTGRYALLWGDWHEYFPDLGYWKSARYAVRREMLAMLADSDRWYGVELSARKVESVLKLAQYFMPGTEEIEIDPDAIPLRNGVYHVKNNTFSEHAPENYFRSAMEYDYIPTANCDLWFKTLCDMIVDEDGKTDFDTIGFMQEMFGYSLWGDNRLQASFFFHGDGGSGKSTTLEILQKLTASKTTIDLETLNEYQLATLVGVRLVVFNELERGAIFPEAAFKRLVSSDTIMARFPRGRPFTYQPIATVVGAMNDLPIVRDRSRGVWRRVYVIPFKNIFTKPDTNLIYKLEKELPGIFNWALTGLSRLRQRGKFSPPPMVVNALQEWREENDIERQFLNSHYVELDKEARTQTSELYRDYVDWCKENGHRHPKSQRQIAKEWKRLGLVQVKDDQRYWQGVKRNRTTINLNLI